jgi:rubredoxin
MPSSDSDARKMSRRWISAAAQMLNNPEGSVECPVCSEEKLDVQIVEWPDGTHVDYHMTCPKCGARNVATRLVRSG